MMDKEAREAIMDLAHAVSSYIGEDEYYLLWAQLFPESLPIAAEKYVTTTTPTIKEGKDDE